MKAKIADTKRLNILGNGDMPSNREILTRMLKLSRQRLGYYSMFAALPAILTSHVQEAQADEVTKPEMSVVEHTAKRLTKLTKSYNTSILRLQPQSNYLLDQQKGKNNIISALAGGDDCPGTPIPGGIYTAAAPFTDSGNTTGANNTVNSVYSFYYSSYNTGGPDLIYSFSLTGRGADPQIQVSATSANYQPLIYILDSRNGGRCPAGTNNFAPNPIGIAFTPGGFASFDSNLINFLPLNVPLYLFIDSGAIGGSNSGPYTLRMQDLTVAPATPARTRFDFDGDRKADISVFRPSNGAWYLNHSTIGFSATQFGLSTDKLTPADFDGDGKTDISVFRDGIWYRLNSSTNSFNAIPFGLASDIPTPADFTGDGLAELAVYRNGFWYTLNLQNNPFNQLKPVQFGLATDKPVVGDYDGDTRADYAVYRDGTWYLLRSTQGFAAIQFGLPTDKLVPADYDGDGKTDVAVYRDGTWYLLGSQTGFTSFQFGLATDVPMPADYDGDNKADLAVFREGIWYLQQSTNGFLAVPFGLITDKAIPSAFLP
jgi:(2Fe-2S) ferredoxin